MDNRKQLDIAEKLLPTPAIVSASIVASVEGAAGKSAIFSALRQLVDAGVQLQFRARPISKEEKEYAEALQALQDGSYEKASTAGREDASGPESLAEGELAAPAQPLASGE